MTASVTYSNARHTQRISFSSTCNNILFFFIFVKSVFSLFPTEQRKHMLKSKLPDLTSFQQDNICCFLQSLSRNSLSFRLHPRENNESKQFFKYGFPFKFHEEFLKWFIFLSNRLTYTAFFSFLTSSSVLPIMCNSSQRGQCELFSIQI